MRKFGLSLFAIAVVAPAVLAASDVGGSLTTELDKIRRRFRLTNAIGVLVQSTDTGETLYAHNADKRFVPASGMKLVTMAAALHYLGPSFRFETQLLVDGPVEQGVVNGSLYIKGSGDPLLTEGDLERIAFDLAASGIREIRGSLCLDDSFFDDRLRGPASYDNILKKGLPIQSALSYNLNIVELRVRPAEVGAQAELHDAGYGYFDVLNRVTTVARGRPWLRVRKLRQDRVVVYGRAVAGDEEMTGGFVAPDPPAYLARAFIGKLQGQGIAFTGETVRRAAVDPALQPLYVHRSPRLIHLVELLGKHSNNFAAEQLLKALGAYRWGAPGSFESGSRALGEYLIGLGFRKEDFRVDDGSGLSYENHLSAAILVRVLSELYRTPELRTDVLCSLAAAGVDGTLAGRFRDEGSLGQIVGKTGSLAGVSSLSGFAFSPRHGPLVFSVLLNGVSRQWRAEAVEDQIARALLGT